MRYRGYYYDAETGFYYVSSRYYDPEVGRWINADSFASTGQGFVGYNMFSYCGNDPVNRKDENGDFWHIIVGAAIGAVTNVALTVVGNLLDDDPDTTWNSGLGLALVTGAVTGGFAVSAWGPAVQMAVNATVSAIEGFSDVVDDINDGVDVPTTLGRYALDIGLSAVTSYSRGLGSKHATKLGKQTIKRTWNVFAHEGFSAGFSEIGKAAKWYKKSAKKIIRSNSVGQFKDALKSGANIILENKIQILFS